MRVLVVEDERQLADSIAEGLRLHAMAVDVAYDGEAGLERASVNDYDVLVLDRDIPIISGDEVCATLVHSESQIRILMLTAAAAVPQRVAGLGLGADDYLTKPFAFAELVARVQALARRARPAIPWLNEATPQYPTVVLGARAAARLGIGPSLIGQPIWLGGRWFTVVGILEPVSLVPALDLCALIGWPAGEHYLDFDGDITTLYVRTQPTAVEAVRDLLAPTANPEQPNEVDVSRPSDALAAEAAADVAFTGLLLGLGAVALLVGGIGVANTMVISVLERRGEIGLRRSQGATRGHIRIQFFGEALLLSLLGGASGILVGWMVTVAYARLQGWPVDIPLWVVAGGMAATLLIGGIAGLYPAIRAARLAPTEALGAA